MNEAVNHSSGKMIIVSAPSGAGKTTIVKHIIASIPSLVFSISATSRQARQGEVDGRDYYFLSPEEFRRKISEEAFIEWEEVYQDHYYGTLKSEINRIWEEGKHIVSEVDVQGAVRLKSIFGSKALSLFIMPPSVEELEKRLRFRKKDSEEKIRMRVAKASEEIAYAGSFDEIIINENLDKARAASTEIINQFLKGDQ